MTSRKNKVESLSLHKCQNEQFGRTKRKRKGKMPSCSCCPEFQNVVVKDNKKEKKIVLKFNSAKKKETKAGNLLKKSVANQESFSCDRIQKPVAGNISPSLSDDKISDSDFVTISEADSCMSERISPNSDHQATPKNYLFETSYENDKPVSALSPDAVDQSLNEDPPPPGLREELSTKVSKSNVSVISCGSNVDIKQNEKQKTYHSTFSSENYLPELEINVETDSSDSTNSEAALQSSVKNSNDCFDSSNFDKNSQYRSTNFKDSLNSMKLGQSFDMELLQNTLNSSKVSKEDLICHQLNIEPLIKPVDFSYDVHNPFNTYVDISVLKAAYEFIMENAINSIPVPSSNMPFENFIGNSSEQINSRINTSEINNYDTSDSQPELINALCSENSEKLTELISDNFINALDFNVSNNELEDNLSNLCSSKLNLLNETTEENSVKYTEVKEEKKKGNYTRKTRKNKSAMSKSNTFSEETLCDTGDEGEIKTPDITSKACDQLLLDPNSSPPLPIEARSEDNKLDMSLVLPGETLCLLNETSKENPVKSSKVKKKRKRTNWYPTKRCKKRNPATQKSKNFKEYLCDTCDESEAEESTYDMASEACSQLPLDTLALSCNDENYHSKLSEDIEYKSIICSINKKKYKKGEPSSETLEIQENINQIICDETLDNINIGGSEVIPVVSEFDPRDKSNSLDIFNTSMAQYCTNDNVCSNQNLSSFQTSNQDSFSNSESQVGYIGTRLRKRKRNSEITHMDDNDRNHEMNTATDNSQKNKCISTILDQKKLDKTIRKKFKQTDKFSDISIKTNEDNQEIDYDQRGQNVHITETNTKSVDSIKLHENDLCEERFTSILETDSSTECNNKQQINIEATELELGNNSVNETFNKPIVLLQKLDNFTINKHRKIYEDESSLNLTLSTEVENSYSIPNSEPETICPNNSPEVSYSLNIQNSEQDCDSKRVLEENMRDIHTLDSMSGEKDTSEVLELNKQTKVSSDKESKATLTKNKQGSSKMNEDVFDSIESDGCPQNDLSTSSCITKVISPGKNINTILPEMRYASLKNNDIISPSKKKLISPVKDLNMSPSKSENKSPEKKSSISPSYSHQNLKSKYGNIENNLASKEHKEGSFENDISGEVAAYGDQSDLPLETFNSAENLESADVAAMKQKKYLETDSTAENFVSPLEVPSVSNEQNINKSDDSVSEKSNPKIRSKKSKDAVRKRSKDSDSPVENIDSESKEQTKLRKKKTANSLLSSRDSFDQDQKESRQQKLKHSKILTIVKEKHTSKKSSSGESSNQNFRQSCQDTELLNALLLFSNNSNLKDSIRNMKPIPRLSQKTKTQNSDSSIQKDKKMLEIDNALIKQTVGNNSDQMELIEKSSLKNDLNDIFSSKTNSDSNEELVLMEDCLDFEPDQSEDIIKSSADNDLPDSASTVQNKSGSPAFVHEEYTYDFLNNHNFDTSKKNWPSEDDSDSDEEHSFKRKRHGKKISDSDDSPVSFRKNVVLEEPIPLNVSECNDGVVPHESTSVECDSVKSSCEDLDTNSSKSEQTSFPKSKVSSGSGACFNDVLIQIRELCSKDLAEEAIDVAKRYLVISSSDDVSLRILQALLISVFSLNMNAVKNKNSNFKIFDDVVNLIRNLKVCNKKLASFFIVKCCSHPDLNPYSKQLFHYCQESNIPLSTEAVNAFCEVEKSKEVPLCDLLNYLRFIKFVCQKKMPKDLLNLALEKCETSMFADVHHICELLHDISTGEVEESCLVKFLQLCFKESMWQYVAEMFIIWGSKNNRLSLTIHSALAADHETVGKYFKKFANYVHGKEGCLSPELTDKLNLKVECKFGQIGTDLMLKSFSQGDLNNASDILDTLHTYNVNYYSLMGNSDLTGGHSEANIFSLKILPFCVVFVAVDICLQLNRPKDAYRIFQDCSWVTVDGVEDDVHAYIGKERCKRLLKLVPLLNNQDSLDEGWDALEKLLTAIKQDLSPELLKENTKNLNRIYEEYMISLLNSEKISLAYILYQHSLGPRKDLFTMSSDVLRGLIVAFAKDGRFAAVKSLLLIGIMKKIYPVQKPKLETFPWEITLCSHWTDIEIKVVVEWYTEILFPLLKNKTNETFEKWFSVKIAFNITPQNASKVECLNEIVTDSKYYITKTKNALQNMNPSLEVTEISKQNALCITSKSLYNFWKNRCPDAATFDMHFVKPQNKFFFGAGEKGRKERDSSVFVHEYFTTTSSTPKSSEEYEYQTTGQHSQRYSPRSPASSPESLDSLIIKARANSSKSTQFATTPEKTPPTQNVRNSVSPRSNGLLSGYNAAVYGNENDSGLQQQLFLPHGYQSQSDSPNVSFRRNKSPRQSLDGQHFAVASTNQSYHENTGISYLSNNTFRPKFNSLPLLPTPNQSASPNFNSLPLLPTPTQSASPKNCFNRSNSNDNSFTENNYLPLLPMPTQSTSPKNCLNRSNSNDNYFTENNYTKQVDSSVRQKSPAAIDRSLVNYQNSTAIRKSIESPSSSHPSVINANVNNQSIIPKLSNRMAKRPAISTPSKLGIKKLKGSSVLPTQTPKNKRKIITFNKTPMKPRKTVLKGKISKALKTPSSRMVRDLSKKDLTSQFTINNETVSNSAKALSSKTENSVVTQPANKMEKETIKKSKTFQNFTVCVTSKARTVNTSSNQSLSALKQSVPNNDGINDRNTEERSRMSFQNTVPISNQNLPAPSKSIQNNPGMIMDVQKSSIEIPSTSFQTPDSDAQISNLPAGSKTVLSSCKRNKIKINRNLENPGASFPAALSSANQSFMSVSRTIQNECKTNAASLSNVNVSPGKSSSTSDISNLAMSKHPPVSKPKSPTVSKIYKINLANNSKNEDKTTLLASTSSPNLVNINQKRQPVNELNKPHTAVINTSPNQSGNSVPKKKITLTRTINLNRATNTDTKNNIVNKPSTNNKITLTQTSKPVIKRSDYRQTLNNYLDSWRDEHGSVPPMPPMSGARHEEPKFELKKIAAESFQSSRPLSGGASCGEEDFNKIEQFLKVKVTQKYKNISAEEHDSRVSSLANAFIQSNEVITKLDKKTMKLLIQFADLNV